MISHLRQQRQAYLKNPVIREQGAWNGNGFKKRYATTNSIASSARNDENRCEETQRFASLYNRGKEKGKLMQGWTNINMKDTALQVRQKYQAISNPQKTRSHLTTGPYVGKRPCKPLIMLECWLRRNNSLSIDKALFTLSFPAIRNHSSIS